MARGRSAYRIVEDSDSRLALRGQTLGIWLLAGILTLPGLLMLYLVFFEVARRDWFLKIMGGALGAFFTITGLAVVWLACTYRGAVVVDPRAALVRLRSTRNDEREVRFEDIEAVELTTGSRPAGRRGRVLEHRVVLRMTNGDEVLLDRSVEPEPMRSLADKVRARLASRGPSLRADDRFKPDRSIEPVPRAIAPSGVAVESDGRGAVYRWATLPRSAFWAFFWSCLVLLFGGLTGVAVVGMVSEMSRQSLFNVALELTLAGLVVFWMYRLSKARRRGVVWLAGCVAVTALANLLLDLVGFVYLAAVGLFGGLMTALCGFVLFGRCRLRLGPEGLEYDERVFGLPLDWRRRALPANGVERFRIRDASRSGGAIQVIPRRGKPFNLAIAQGVGAYSRAELEGLRRLWLEDLRAEKA